MLLYGVKYLMPRKKTCMFFIASLLYTRPETVQRRLRGPAPSSRQDFFFLRYIRGRKFEFCYLIRGVKN